MPPLTPTTLITRSPNLIAADVDGDLVMMSIDQGEYFAITGAGSRVWELLAVPTTVADIVRVICAECTVEELACQADMHTFVENLIQLGIATAV